MTTQVTDITQALQSAYNAHAYKNTADKYQSTWLTDYTKTVTGPLDELLGYVALMGIESIQDVAPISGRVHYVLWKGETYAGMIDQPQLEHDKKLAPDGWIAIILKGGTEEVPTTVDARLEQLLEVEAE